MKKYKFPQELNIKEDGTRMTLEEALEFLNNTPINEQISTFEFEPINCTMEEFLKTNGGVSWDDIKGKYLNRNANTNTNNQ